MQQKVTVVELKSWWRWGVPLFALAGLAVLLLTGQNISLFLWMNRLFAHAPDTLWTHFSLLADGQFIIMFMLPFIGRRPEVVWQFLLALILGGLYVPGMKELFSELRPPGLLEEGTFHLIGPALQLNSFPSGHTTAAFAIAGLVCLYRLDYRFKIAAIILATIVGFSRIANGVHWPLDVLGGMIGGWLIANAAIWWSWHWQGGMQLTVQRVFAAILLPLSLWGVWSLWMHLDDVYPGTGLMKIVFLVTCAGLSVPGLLRLYGSRRHAGNDL